MVVLVDGVETWFWSCPEALGKEERQQRWGRGRGDIWQRPSLVLGSPAVGAGGSQVLSEVPDFIAQFLFSLLSPSPPLFLRC